MTTANLNATGISKSVVFGELVCGELTSHKFKKGINQLEISQEVTTTTVYPSSKINNSLFASAIAAGSEFTSVSKRMFWLDVPESVSEKDAVKAVLASGGKIIRHLYSDIMDTLSSEDQWAINNGKTTIDELRNARIVKDSEGVIVKDKEFGQEMYRKYTFETEENSLDFLIYINYY
jgi:hypothetical protein